jgi:hypothetical protein
MLEILLCAQDRELQARHFHPHDRVAGKCRTSRVRVGERMAKAVAARIGMTLDKREALRHGWGSVIGHVSAIPTIGAPASSR